MTPMCGGDCRRSGQYCSTCGAEWTAHSRAAPASINQPAAVSIEIPAPPSVNEMFRNVRGRGRVKTAAYNDWLGHAGWVLRSQSPDRVGGRVVLVISVERASKSADIDNRVKAILDLLVTHGVIEDDRNVVGFAAAWAPPANKMARVLVIPAATMAAEFHLADDGTTGGWFIRPTTAQDSPNALSA